MLASFADQKHSNPAVWTDEFVCLGQEKSNFPPEEGSDARFFRNFGGGFSLAADARLDGRSALFEQLDIPDSERKNFDDLRLIAASYEKWGEDCPEHLLGNYAFAVWNKASGRLFLAHDHLGRKPLFYYADDKRFVFAGAPKAILAVRGIENRINKNKLAALMLPQTKFLFAEESWFENISALPAGMSLTVDKNGVRTRRFWQPQPPQEKLSFKNESEILEAFRELMFEVVGDHLRGAAKVSALLSGGLDSSAIVSVAAKILERQNRELHTLSAVLPDEHDAGLADERHFIDRMRAIPNISINYVADTHRGPFDDPEDLIGRNDSPNISSRHYLYSAFVEKAVENSSEIILDGAGGELSATFDGLGAYAEMFLHLKWSALWRELNLRKNLGGESIAYNVRANIIHPLVPEFLYKRRRGSKTSFLLEAQNDSLFENDFAEDLLRRIEPRLSNLDDYRRRFSPFHRRNQFHNISEVVRKSTLGGLAFNDLDGIEFRFPFKDKRLLEFCLAVPYNLKVRDGYQRYLIRAGLNELLPPEIRWRTTKLPFSPDYARRYRRQIPQILDFLADISPGDAIRKVINIPKLIETAKLSAEDNDIFGGQLMYDVVPQGVYLIYFLRRFSEFQN